jgi:RNA polymerase sigma-70 factor, ECF subfamily
MDDFRTILAQHQDRVFRLARGILGDAAQAEDAAQETFIKVWRGLPKFRGESSVSTWIFSIARNTCLNALKARKRTVPIDQLVERPCYAPESFDVESLLAELPEHYREVIVMFYVQDKSYKEVSRALQLPNGNRQDLLAPGAEATDRPGCRE